MESEDFIALPASGDSGCGDVNDEHNDSQRDSKEIVDSQPTNSEDKEYQPNIENLGHESIAQCEGSQCIPEANLANELVDNDSDMEIEDINNLPVLVDKSSVLQVSVALTETVTVARESSILHSALYENGDLAVQDASPFGIHNMDGTCILRPHLLFCFLLVYDNLCSKHRKFM